MNSLVSTAAVMLVLGTAVAYARLIGGSREVIDVLNVPLLDLDHGRVKTVTLVDDLRACARGKPKVGAA